MNKSDNSYALFWAKKIKAINIMGGRCLECGNSNIFQLEFHHEGEKDKRIGILLKGRWTEIVDEINKCVLLCRNCHGIKHSPRENPLKIKLMEIYGENKCIRCGYDTLSSTLDFHHIDEGSKRFRISRGYKGDRWKIPLEIIIKEMDKCILLCKNCHAIDHVNMSRFDRLKNSITYKVENYVEKQGKINRNIMLELKQKGYGIVEISKMLGCAKSTVSMALKNAT